MVPREEGSSTEETHLGERILKKECTCTLDMEFVHAGEVRNGVNKGKTILICLRCRKIRLVEKDK